MMKTRAPECGLEAVVALVGAKWKLLILYYLTAEPRRFGELKRLVGGISEKMLIQQLREMVADEIVTREDFKTIPPRVEYAVTEFGRGLGEALKPLNEWGEANKQRVVANRRSERKGE
jgi:DNA-binding HxlR family transcriptional regulator